MSKALKNVGFFLVTIALTAVIFWLVFIDKESKQDVLEYSLGLLGDKLMAMVPEGEERAPVKILYDNFVEQAKQQEVSPEKIENVAATIFNMSNMDTVVTAKEAEALLRFSLAEPVRIERVAPESVVIGKCEQIPQFVAVSPPLPPPKKRSPEEWRIAGERIRSAYRFNSEYQQAMKQYEKQLHDQHVRMKFEVDNGLRIAIDANARQDFDHERFAKLNEEMKKMEKERIIVWRKNFQEEMLKQREKMKCELESLQKLKELEKLEALQGLEALETLKNLEVLQYIPIVNADSIRIVIEKSLEEAKVKK